MSTRKFIKKLTASLLFIAVVMSFGVQSAFAESNSPKAITEYAKRWGKLLNENTSMRIWHANDVKSVNIDYFDQRIISLVSRIPISVGELTADVLKAISAPVSDWYVMKRIEALLKKGVLQVVIPNKIFYNTIVQLNEE